MTPLTAHKKLPKGEKGIDVSVYGDALAGSAGSTTDEHGTMLLDRGKHPAVAPSRPVTSHLLIRFHGAAIVSLRMVDLKLLWLLVDGSWRTHKSKDIRTI